MCKPGVRFGFLFMESKTGHLGHSWGVFASLLHTQKRVFVLKPVGLICRDRRKSYVVVSRCLPVIVAI